MRRVAFVLASTTATKVLFFLHNIDRNCSAVEVYGKCKPCHTALNRSMIRWAAMLSSYCTSVWLRGRINARSWSGCAATSLNWRCLWKASHWSHRNKCAVSWNKTISPRHRSCDLRIPRLHHQSRGSCTHPEWFWPNISIQFPWRVFWCIATSWWL